MPFLIPLLAGVSSFFAGAYIGNVVDEANKAPSIVIEDASVSAEKDATKKLVFYGIAGLAIYYVWRRWK